MPTACLVLGHNAAPILRRSVLLYVMAGWDVYVHLDRKIDRAAYEAALSDTARLCTFVEEPVEVFWGGYSMVAAEFKLLELAASRKRYERFLLVTDDTMPFLPPEQLRAYFAPGVDYITADLQTKGVFFNRYDRFFLNDHRPTAMRSRSQDNVYVEDDFIAAVGRLAALKARGKAKIPVYFGSQFWSLTADSVALVRETVDNDPALRESFEFAALPDELMFQSIIGHLGKRPRKPGPVFADFSVRPGPRVFTEIADLALITKPTVFFRKLSPAAEALADHVAQALNDGRSLSP